MLRFVGGRTRRGATALSAIMVMVATTVMVAGGAAHAAPVEQTKLTASDASPGDSFGRVAISGDTIVVGAPSTDGAGSASGSAYVFKPDGNGGYTEQELVAADASGGDSFGSRVAVAGDVVVVGAVFGDGVVAGSGAAYVFKPDGLGGYNQTKLVASDGTASDFFGESVALAGDTIVVGASRDDVVSSDSGSVYVFNPDGLGGYTQTKLTAPTPTYNASFGISVAISGTTILAGAFAPGGLGAAYVFEPDGVGGYSSVKLTASDAASLDGFGISVAISGGTIVVGAYSDDGAFTNTGSAYVFEPDGLGGYSETKLTASDAASNDLLGVSVAVSGGMIVAGSQGDGSGAGSAYVFEPDGAGGYTEVKLTASDADANDFFSAVAMSGDTIVVGAPGDDGAGTDTGAAYVFGPPVITVPGAPTVDSVVPGDGQVTLSWTPPVSDGGSPITGYVVTPWYGEGSHTPITFSSTDTTQTITGLTNGITHWFTVAAVNAVGTGPESEGSNSAEPGTVPDAPTIGTAAAGDGAAIVAWSAPVSDGGSSVLGYVVTPYVGAVAQTPVTFISTDTSQTVSGLTNGATYSFTVAATNVFGPGAESAMSNAVTPMPATVPGAPTIGGAALAGSGRALVSWTAPASNGGSPITGYVVTPYVGFFPLPSVTFLSTATTQTVTGLTDGTTYRFRVRAINAVGTGGYSTVTNPLTPAPATVPGAPTIGSATAGSGQALVSWTAPASNGGSPITGYVVTPYVGFFPLPSVTFLSTATTQTVTGLVPGTTYRFRVRAINAIGTGGYSTVTNPVTPTP